MNYLDYVKKVEEALATMNSDRKDELLRQLLVGVSESKRMDYLKMLKEDNGRVEYTKEKIAFSNWYQKVQDGNIYFDVYEHGHYENTPYGEEYEQDFEDPHGIAKTYRKYYDFSLLKLQNCQYEDALYFLEPLLRMEFYGYSQTEEVLVEFTLENLIEEGVISINYRKSIPHLLYLYYQILQGGSRAQKFYEVLSQEAHLKIKLEDVFTAGPKELKDIEKFLSEFIVHLENIPDGKAAVLLSEAAFLFGGSDYLCTVALAPENKHPLLFLSACDALLREKRLEDAERIGLLGLERIPKELVIRADIARAVEEAAEFLGHQDIVLSSRLEAFYSRTTAFNYLEVCGVATNKEVLRSVRDFVRFLPDFAENAVDQGTGEWRKNRISMKEKDAILFLSGEWARSYEKYKNIPGSLGWSSDSKGVIVPLFLIGLFEGESLHKAGLTLYQDTFQKLGMYSIDEERNNAQFQSWRRFYTFSKEESTTYLPWIEKEVENRVDGIVSNSYRYSYWKAALLVAMLGEVRESRGEPSGKKKLIDLYKKKYSRRSAFRKELDVFLD